MTPLSRTTGCRWPIDHEGATWFCDAPVVRGSYCGEHGARCYVDWKNVHGRSQRSYAEMQAVFWTRAERIDKYVPNAHGPRASKSATPWDEGRKSK